MSSLIRLCLSTAPLLTQLADLQVWAPQHGRGLSFEGHPQPYESLVFPHALQHAVLFEALIALSQASWLLQEGYSWLHDSALAYHRANAFAALRVRLESDKTCADDTTIMSIAALTTIDVSKSCLLDVQSDADIVHARDS